jgi:hypothetical protein
MDSADPPEARTLRQVLKVNGHAPRTDDHNNCTTPEQQASEPQPLSRLLPAQRREYTFSMVGTRQLDRREALVIDYRMNARPTVEVSMVEGKDDCISFEVNGGIHGRLWLDADTHEVMRLDQSLNGLVEIPLPRKAARFAGMRQSWTMERLDSSIRFKRIAFEDPEETLMLPVSSISLRVTRGSGVPRLRTVTEYSSYKRFLTGARVVPQ